MELSFQVLCGLPTAKLPHKNPHNALDDALAAQREHAAIVSISPHLTVYVQGKVADATPP